MSDLPTKPGPYYWREKDGDEWEIHTVFIDDELNHTLMALCPIDDTWYATENWGGQWLPIPTAEELVELIRLVDEVLSWGEKIIDTYNFPEDGLAMAHDFIKLQAYAAKLRKEIGE
jgi:hypothetical protein